MKARIIENVILFVVGFATMATLGFEGFEGVLGLLIGACTVTGVFVAEDIRKLRDTH